MAVATVRFERYGVSIVIHLKMKNSMIRSLRESGYASATIPYSLEKSTPTTD